MPFLGEYVSSLEGIYIYKDVYVTTYVPKIGGSIADDFFLINPIRTRPSPVRFEGVVVLGPSFFCVEACV